MAAAALSLLLVDVMGVEALGNATPTSDDSDVNLPKHVRAGRPTAITDAFVVDRYFEALRRTGSRAVAAHAVGWNAKTVQGWIDRGERRLRDRSPTPAHVDFAERVSNTEAEVEAEVVANLVRLSARNPRAALFWLQARHPERWPRSRGRTRQPTKRRAKMRRDLA